MKKLIARTLALVLCLCMTGFSSAEFTDVSEIDDTFIEAVTVMSELNIINGFENGSFGPEKTLTRAQAAKILCCVLLGDGVNTLTSRTSSFSDVPADNWASPFVEYCAEKGIVAGIGNGKFNPSGELTGFAFAKMLLVAVGFDASALIGDKWADNTATLLTENGLAAGVKVTSGQMTREQACGLASNFLFYGGENDCLSYRVFKVTRAVGNRDNNGNYGRPTRDYTSEESGKYWDGETLNLPTAPIATFYGKVTGDQAYKAIGNIEPENFQPYRNGNKGVTFTNNIIEGNSGTLDSTNAGICAELYYFLETDTCELIEIATRIGQITDCTAGVITITDANDSYPTVLTFKTEKYTEGDIGKWLFYSGYAKTTWREITNVLSVFDPVVVTGTLGESTDAIITINNKGYTVMGNQFSAIHPSLYLENGGKNGDNVKAYMDKHGICYGVETAG